MEWNVFLISPNFPNSTRKLKGVPVSAMHSEKADLRYELSIQNRNSIFRRNRVGAEVPGAVEVGWVAVGRGRDRRHWRGEAE